jgi:hypothetical protein
MAEKYFSVSDIQAFLQCRMKWHLSSPNRRSLRHNASPRMYLTQGTAMHEAIDTNAKHPGSLTYPMEAAGAFLTAEREAKVEDIKRRTGFSPWPAEMAEWDDAADFTAKLIRQYFDHYGVDNPLADQGMEYVATEVPFKIDISGLTGIEDAYFVGTFDGIAVDEHGNLWLVENKTYGQKPDLTDLVVHFQTTGYAVAWEMLTGKQLTGAIYNGVAKKLIAEPRRLKDGSLSSDKRQQTTYKRFSDALRRDGIPLGHPKYADILKKLKDIEDQGDDRFFYRESFYFNEKQITHWIEEFIDIVREMNDNPKIYRTVSFKGCGSQGADCWWRDVCFAQHTGQDVEMLLDQRYKVGAYGTFDAVDGIEAIQVSSIEELREALTSHG